MPNWLLPMEQTYEYYIVDPITWKDVRIVDTVTSCNLTRDLEVDTLGSADIDIGEMIGESYIRVYLITVQNGIRDRIPLGTILVQTQSHGFDGMKGTSSFDGYTPLIELKEKPPPLGYYTPKDSVIMNAAYSLVNTYARAPVVKATDDSTLYRDFVANTDDTWVTYVSDLIANAKFYLDLDELGRILFAPKQDVQSLRPVWTYDDGNSSILYPEVTYERDLYGIPNVVEVIYSDEHDYYAARVVNDDVNSPISTINRGREIPYRVSNPEFSGIPTQAMVEQYAEQTLRDISTIECTISYTHGYCPVRIGDCVRLNYERANLIDIKARVIRQTIKCEPGCPVSETATFTQKLWR